MGRCMSDHISKRRFFRKRSILFGLVAVELMSIPAAASVVQKVRFEVKPHVAAGQLPTLREGQSRFLVSSNAPFSVVASGMIGEVDVAVQQRGEIAAQTFGEASQLPGPARACAVVLSAHDTVIYRADRRTAAQPGNAVEQAVVVTVAHVGAAPDIEFVTDTAAPDAAGC